MKTQTVTCRPKNNGCALFFTRLHDGESQKMHSLQGFIIGGFTYNRGSGTHSHVETLKMLAGMILFHVELAAGISIVRSSRQQQPDLGNWACHCGTRGLPPPFLPPRASCPSVCWQVRISVLFFRVIFFFYFLFLGVGGRVQSVLPIACLSVILSLLFRC